MPAMGKFRGFQALGWYIALLLVMAGVGCSRPGGLRTAESDSQARGQGIPFHQDAGSGPGQAPPDGATAHSEIPFNSSPLVTLPAGTLLTVRLETALSGARRDAGTEFVAVVDAPVTLDGSPVLARGTNVRGRVECAHISETQSGAGFVCLTLDSVLIGGKAMPLQTSSLFARGDSGESRTDAHSTGASGPPASMVHLSKGHRLTFRLSKDAVLARLGAEGVSADLSPGTR